MGIYNSVRSFMRSGGRQFENYQLVETYISYKEMHAGFTIDSEEVTVGEQANGKAEAEKKEVFLQEVTPGQNTSELLVDSFYEQPPSSLPEELAYATSASFEQTNTLRTQLRDDDSGRSSISGAPISEQPLETKRQLFYRQYKQNYSNPKGQWVDTNI
ncbi:MAG: hypothetical protein FH748_00945 [Balneolaceae bacterium]|nr:hypothetical protein [Balneolaceae bacterium]